MEIVIALVYTALNYTHESQKSILAGFDISTFSHKSLKENRILQNTIWFIIC